MDERILNEIIEYSNGKPMFIRTKDDGHFGELIGQIENGQMKYFDESRNNPQLTLDDREKMLEKYFHSMVENEAIKKRTSEKSKPGELIINVRSGRAGLGPDGQKDQIRVTVPDNYTVLQLKNVLFNEINIPISHQKILFNGKFLMDEKRLVIDYKMVSGDNIYVSIEPHHNRHPHDNFEFSDKFEFSEQETFQDTLDSTSEGFEFNDEDMNDPDLIAEYEGLEREIAAESERGIGGAKSKKKTKKLKNKKIKKLPSKTSKSLIGRKGKDYSNLFSNITNWSLRDPKIAPRHLWPKNKSKRKKSKRKKSRKSRKKKTRRRSR